ncbi:MAG: hypothetical protein WD688_17970 [Candidatus Binatia bacterium]
MSTNNPGENKIEAEPSVWASDDDLSTFALPISSSSRDIQTLVRRYPLIALIAAVWLGIGIGKLTRLV